VLASFSQQHCPKQFQQGSSAHLLALREDAL